MEAMWGGKEMDAQRLVNSKLSVAGIAWKSLVGVQVWRQGRLNSRQCCEQRIHRIEETVTQANWIS